MASGGILALLLLPAAILAVAVVLAYVQVPRTTDLVLRAWPKPAWLYVQAGLAALTKGRAGTLNGAASRSPPVLKVSMARPVAADPARLAKFLQLVQYPGALQSSASLPLMYPIVESFRLVIQAMLLPAFPFNVLGSVLARNTTTMYRAVAADEKLLYSVSVDLDGARTTQKGDTEVDLIAVATTEAGSSAPVWRSTTTAIILNPKRNKRPAAGTAQPQVPPAEALKRVPIKEWKLGGDTGRKYGMLNADLNPIHLHPLTSNLFGFKRPIAHALFLVARAEASLREAGVQYTYPVMLETEFKRPTLLPAKLVCAWEPPAGGPAAAVQPAGAGINFAVLTEDGSKEVLTGRLAPATR